MRKVDKRINLRPLPTNSRSFSKAVYDKPDLLEVAKYHGVNHIPAQLAMFFKVLTDNTAVFSRGCGKWNGKPIGLSEPISLMLKPDVKLCRAKAYPIPLKNREAMEHELARQFLISCLQRLTSEQFKERKWAFPGFGTPKKNGMVRFVINFHQINQALVRGEYLLWTTEEIPTSIQGFLYATSIDLNMGYPSIPFNDVARKILMIIMPFRVYECLMLPMGVMPASDLFQYRMVHIFADMGKDHPLPYIDDILHTKRECSRNT